MNTPSTGRSPAACASTTSATSAARAASDRANKTIAASMPGSASVASSAAA
jgi:hypothetical protein